MAEGGMKRKRYAQLKKDLSVELHKLTNASGDLNNDLRIANKEFEKMLNTISAKQSEFLSRSVVLEEQYREAISVLKEAKQGEAGSSRGENVVLPKGYCEDVRKFATDVKTSLIGHGAFFNEETEEMGNLMQKYDKECTNIVQQLKMRSDVLAEQRNELSKKLYKFINTVEESEDEEDDDEEEEFGGESSEEP